MGLSRIKVWKWRNRYPEFCIECPHDELRLDCPRTNKDDKVAKVINRALQTKPSAGSTSARARLQLGPESQIS